MDHRGVFKRSRGPKKSTTPLFQESVVGEPVVLTVGACISVINNALERLGGVVVRGEISDASVRENYAFFDLKDTAGQDYVVKCFIGRWQLNKYRHLVENGLEVTIVARPNVYKSGNLSLMVESIEPYGAGALQKAFEALKSKLEQQGLFDQDRKREVPTFIERIGLITSEEGAAINDFKRNLGEHGFKIFVHDVRVEGAQAEKSLVRAVRWFAAQGPQVDVIVLIRGGGGLENLKAFNSEDLALAIAQSRVPVITGIGHEKDVSIADFVADRYFSTPTAVAAFLRSQREELVATVEDMASALLGNVEFVIERKKEMLDRVGEHLDHLVGQMIERTRLTLLRWYSDMLSSVQKVFSLFKETEQEFLSAFVRAEHVIALKKQEVSAFETALVSLDPSAILRRGYSVAYTNKNHVIKNAQEVRPGEKIIIKVFKGTIKSNVEKINP